MSRVGVFAVVGEYQSATGIVRVDVDQSDERTVGYMLANNTALVQIVKPVMEEMLASDRGDQFRRDLRLQTRDPCSLTSRSDCGSPRRRSAAS